MNNEVAKLKQAVTADDQPFMDYVERRIRGQVCPQCGSNKVAFISRALPDMSPALELLRLEEKVVFGGCLVGHEDKELYCNHCGKEFDRKRYRKRKDI